MKSYKGRGVVLHTLKYGENALIVQMLTREQGRCSFIAQGIRSSKGHGSKAALFQPLFALEYEGLASTKMELRRFREVRSGITLRSTPFDIRKSAIALFVAEVLYRLIKESEVNESLFDFVWGSIEALDEAEEGIANFHLWFISNLSRFIGFSPGNCHQKDSWFDIREGLFVAQKPEGAHFSREASTLFNDFLESDVRHIAEIGLNRGQRSDLMNAVVGYYGYHLDAIYAVGSIRILGELF